MVFGCPKGIDDWRKTVASKLISSEVDSISPDSQSLLSLQLFAGGTPCSKSSRLTAVDWMSTKPGSMIASGWPMQTSELCTLKLASRRFLKIFVGWLLGFRSTSVRKAAWNLPASTEFQCSMYLRKLVRYNPLCHKASEHFGIEQVTRFRLRTDDERLLYSASVLPSRHNLFSTVYWAFLVSPIFFPQKLFQQKILHAQQVVMSFSTFLST